LTKNTPIIINERSLIQKASFPREAIVLAVVLSNLFHFLISLVLLMVVLTLDKFLFDHYSFLQTCLYLLRFFLVIPVIVWLTILVSGFSLLFSALNVRFRGVNFIVQALIAIWFYATPIVYSIELLPEKLRAFLYLNPMTAVSEMFHFVLLNIHPYSFDLVLLGLSISLMVFFIGWKVFEKESKFFDDWV